MPMDDNDQNVGDFDPDQVHDFQFNVSYPYSLDTKIKQVRENLDRWKELIIPVYKIFIWEKQWHPLAITGVSTTLFMFLWLSETSVLTIISLVGLFATLCDYMIPTILSSLCQNDKWTPQKEALLEEICAEVVLLMTRFKVSSRNVYKLKETNPKMHFALTILCLVILAWIGNSFNNLFLSYLCVTFVLLYPGIERKGFDKKFKDLIFGFMGSHGLKKEK